MVLVHGQYYVYVGVCIEVLYNIPNDQPIITRLALASLVPVSLNSF